MFADTNRHFHKLSIRKMQYRVTEINIDFDDNFELSQQSFINDVVYHSCDADLVKRLHLPQDFALILLTIATF